MLGLLLDQDSRHPNIPFLLDNKRKSSLAMAHLYITLAMMFRRYDFELHDTIWERDIRIVRDCFVGEVSPDTKGVRIKHAHKPLYNMKDEERILE